MISGPIQHTWHSDGNRHSTKGVERLDFGESSRNTLDFSWLRTYAAYYIISLLYNAFIISFYVVQAFGEHNPCLTRGG